MSLYNPSILITSKNNHINYKQDWLKIFSKDQLNQEAMDHLKKLFEIERRVNREDLLYKTSDTEKGYLVFSMLKWCDLSGEIRKALY